MPYISIHPRAANHEFLQGIDNRNAFFNSILDLIRTGQLPIKIENAGGKTTVTLEKKKEKEPLEIQKVIVNINRQNQGIEESKARTRYIMLQADYLETFKKPLGLGAARMLKSAVTVVSVNQTLSCPVCNEHFRYSDRVTLNAQKDALVDHHHQKHGALPQQFVDDLGTLKA